MRPHRRILKWEEVIEYAFLSDFNLLRDGRQDISKFPWASPMGHHAMDLHFKMCRAREEIQWLNIEIRRLVTYIRDEEKYLHECESRLKVIHPGLAHQVSHQCNVRGRFTLKHLKHLRNVANLPGFSRTIVPGESMMTGPGESAGPVSIHIPTCMLRDCPMDIADTLGGGTETENDWEDEEDAEDMAESVSRAFHDLLHIAEDSVGVFPCTPED